MKHLSSILIISLLGFAVSCARPNRSHSTPPVEVIPPVVLEPVNPLHNVFKSENVRLSILDLRNIGSGGTFAASDILETQCTSSELRGDPAKTDGVADNDVRIIGDSETGVIQFGRLTSDGNSDDPCQVMATEPYSYVLTGNVLRLCNLRYLLPDGSPEYCDNFISL